VFEDSLKVIYNIVSMGNRLRKHNKTNFWDTGYTNRSLLFVVHPEVQLHIHPTF